MYAVILAGGAGTRLLPLSTPERPKPFLPLLGDETLFQRTVRRIAPLVDEADIFCVVDRRFGHLVREQAPGVGLIVEPAGRNTAAAIALATTVIDRPDDDVMLVLPADHWIENEDAFRDLLEIATGRLATGVFNVEDPFVTLGVRPTHPSTDYGYLRPDTMRSERVGDTRAYPLIAFEEKPNEHRARELLDMPGVAWNAGMFAWRRGAIRAAIEKYTPLMTLIAPAVGSELALGAAYDRITPISIDRAVMESAAADHRVVMASMDVGWSDLGSWTALLAAIAGRASAAGTASPATGPVSGRVVQTGETIQLGADDLVIRSVDGSLAVDAASQGTIVADGVWAHLAGAGHLGSEVRALLDRVQQEERA